MFGLSQTEIRGENPEEKLENLQILSLQRLEQACFLKGSRLEADQAIKAIWPCLSSPAWGVKAKALITLGRVGGKELAPLVLELLEAEQDPAWQLQALDCWWQLPLSHSQQEQEICRLFNPGRPPVVLRALAYLASHIGGVAMAEALAQLITAPWGCVVSQDFLWLAWLNLYKNLTPKELVKADVLVSSLPKLKVWLKYWQEPESIQLNLYPSQDYLWQLAKKEGLSQKEFKELYFKFKNKKFLV